MLGKLVDLRAQADAMAHDINRHVGNYSMLKTTYQKFLATGGVSDADFVSWIKGGLDKKPVKRRGSLRLVHSKKVSLPRVMLSKPVPDKPKSGKR